MYSAGIRKTGKVTMKLPFYLNFSFLVDEMKTFAGQQIEPLFQFSWLIVFLTLLLCGALGLLLAFTVDAKLGIAVALSLLALLYVFFSKSV